MVCFVLSLNAALSPLRLFVEFIRHVKHYEGRKLMKGFKSGQDLAKEMGISPDVLQKTCKQVLYSISIRFTDFFLTVDKYNEVGEKNTDP